MLPLTFIMALTSLTIAMVRSADRNPNEALGLGAALSYNENTKDVGLFASLEFWFGREQPAL